MSNNQKANLIFDQIKTELSNNSLSIDTINDYFNTVERINIKINKIGDPIKTYNNKLNYLLLPVHINEQEFFTNSFAKNHPSESSEGYNNMIYICFDNCQIILRYTT
jgi:hypothetical protein